MIFALTLLLVVVMLTGAVSGLTWLMVFTPMIAWWAYLLLIITLGAIHGVRERLR
tara:strand:+ start:171 stop:335 length:165 start_codon:yes stop_codon:yes gene_type:complete